MAERVSGPDGWTGLSVDVPPPPRPAQIDRLSTVLAPLSRITAPLAIGINRIPDRGALFVGNHTILGLFDVPFMMRELWLRRGILPRGLGDHAHYALPLWRDLLESGGMVRGTRENVRELMRRGEHVLVYPGGADEVMKGRGQRYRLLWKQRLGFAQLAIEFGYPIVPFSAVGGDDMFDVIADRETPGLAQASKLAERVTGRPLPPLVAGVGPTLIPRPERLYFSFGEPIETEGFHGRHDDDQAARELRDQVRDAVSTGIDELLELRADDPGRSLRRRLRGGLDGDGGTGSQTDRADYRSAPR